MFRRLVLLPLLLVAPLSAGPDVPPKKVGPEAPKAALKKPLFASDTLAGLRLRSVGPATFSGRVVGLAVHPHNRSTFYVAVASGGVWKTTNAGTTWSPIFDNEGSYSIGYVTLDPKNPNTVWVGSGENNSQRSVGYGDGVYKSLDGGKSWRNVGLTTSEHIGKILIDPRDSNTVYVAAQGPLWKAGGERGLYKTTDGGQSWQRILNIGADTGVTDVVLDPRSPDVLIAAAWQRRRHVWTLINGGPESALYRSTDGGKNWTKLKSGLPNEDLGRIGLAVAPSNPDIVYATVEAANGKGGIFRSTNRGVTWEKRNPFDSIAMYYAHLVVDPKNSERIYVMNMLIQVSDDGGKTLRPLGQRHAHVDNHCIWIDPADTNYYLVGCDGGLYESFDRAANWKYHANLPVTQFYEVAVDDAAPFYNIYGGTQDNFTLGGPSRTRSTHGITNADWWVFQGGDGFHCKVDPRDPNTVYAELQYGGLTRFDRRTGEQIGIQPQPGRGEPALRWNWSSPLVLSPHLPTRLYFAANRVFRSDNRGDSWTAISGDLTRQIDRDKLPVMGKQWGPDAVARHNHTSFFGNLVALAESPKKEGLLYAGTDDGLLQVTHDAGKTWRKIERFPGVPAGTYVARILASQHAADTVYAVFNNHKNGDFAPYLLVSNDGGKTWRSLTGTVTDGRLPNEPVLSIAEDHVDPQLLFAGTERGLYFTKDGGQRWVRLKSGLPTIAVRDLAIQKRENDLVLGTFGRGFYVLDDYSLLRNLTAANLQSEAHLFPVKEALLYVPTRQFGLRNKSFFGEAFYTAENPPFGAVFTYHLSAALLTAKQKRQSAEKKGKAEHPTREQLRAEEEEEAPAALFTITDATGAVVRRITGPVTKGTHRVAWDLREPAATLPRVASKEGDEDVFRSPPAGPLVVPGTYKVALSLRVAGVERAVSEARTFKVVVPGPATGSQADRQALHELQRKVVRLQRALTGTLEGAQELEKRLGQIKRALDQAPGATAKGRELVRALEQRNRDILRALRGDVILRKRTENVPLSITDRVGRIVSEQRYWLARPTKTHEEAYAIASAELAGELGKLRALIGEARELDKVLEGAPWVPGRLPVWKEK